MAEKLSEKYGLPPGTAVYVGDEAPEGELLYRCLRFKGLEVEEIASESPQAAFAFFDENLANWITVQGVHDAGEIESLGKFFGLHPLMVEDIINTEQRPKIEFYGDQIFVVIRLFHREEDGLEPENVSLVLGKNFVLAFLERTEDYFTLVRGRLRLRNNRIQAMGVSYLLFALMDLLVDRYYVTLDWFEAEIMELDDELFHSTEAELLHRIHDLKKDVTAMHRNTRQLVEISASLTNGELEMINPDAAPYFRDLQDHVKQVVEALDNFREMLFNLQSQYLALSSQKMNEVMKFLTMMGSIFIPLTFIAGVYGMNFKNMPELDWGWGYYGSLGLMGAVAVALLIFFRRKRWL
ncbi:MAG: magnesium/cobalt transporter CorA [bacterium]|nr:magnesium/cobalt transporter CorA [bacterium]